MSRTIRMHGMTDLNPFCCGLVEYDGLNKDNFTPEGAMATIAASGGFDLDPDEREGESYAHVILTQMYHPSKTKDAGCQNLYALRDYAHKHRLGEVVIGRTKRNPNSGNMVVPAMLSLHQNNLRDWMDKNGVVSSIAEYRENPYFSRW